MVANRVDQLWRTLLDETFPSFSESSRGKYHLVEGDDGYTLYVSAPGYKSDDITVEVHEGRLMISGKPSGEHQSLGMIVPDRVDLRFSLSPNYLVDSAEITDGILAVKVKRTGKTEAVKIPIQTK